MREQIDVDAPGKRDSTRSRSVSRRSTTKKELAHAVLGANLALDVVCAHERVRARVVREGALLPNVVDARAYVPLRVGVHGTAHVPPAVEADDHYDVVARHRAPPETRPPRPDANSDTQLSRKRTLGCLVGPVSADLSRRPLAFFCARDHDAARDETRRCST